MANFDLTTMAAVVTEYKNKKGLQDISPLDKFWIENSNVQQGRFQGSKAVVPVIYGSSLGTGVTAAAAGTNAAAGANARFEVSTVKLYHRIKIDNEFLQSAYQEGEGSFYKAVTDPVKAGMNALAKEIEFNVPRNDYGIRATVASESTTTLTLTEEADSLWLEEDMTLGAASSEGAAARSGTQTIAAINGATITGDGNWSAISGLTAGDVLFRVNTTTEYGARSEGFGSLFPTSRTGTVHGVNVATNANKLGGVYYDGSSETLSQAFINGSARGATFGARPDFYSMNPKTYGELCVELEQQKRITSRDAKGSVGLTGICVNTPGGVAEIVPVPSVPVNRIYGINKGSVQILHRGEKLMNWATDGANKGEVLQYDMANDVYQAQLVCYYNVVSNAPGLNVVIALA